MSFEQLVREKISTTSSKVARDVLKLVLGEYQQKNATVAATSHDAYAIIEKIVNSNQETLGFLKQEDPRRNGLEEENQTLKVLLAEGVAKKILPYYHNVDEVLKRLEDTPSLKAQVGDLLSKVDRSLLLDDNKNKRWVGQATGAIVKHFQAEKLDVKGEVVKEALARI
jgi:septum formation topological specificity factor MinE